MVTKLDAGNALGIAVEGLKRQETAVAKAADDLNANLVAAQNQLAAATGRGEAAPKEEAPVAQDGLATRVAPEVDGDITRPIVNLLQAKTAYTANLTAVKVAGDIQQQTVDMLGRHKTVEA